MPATLTIDIGTTADNVFKLDKDITWARTGIGIYPTSAVSRDNPVFVIDRNDTLLTCNYVKYLDMYYYICDISADTAQRMTIHCTIDPLTTFKDDILNCEITALRNGGIGHPTKIPDSKLPILPNEERIEQTVATNGSLTYNGTYNYVLTVIGGTVS